MKKLTLFLSLLLLGIYACDREATEHYDENYGPGLYYDGTGVPQNPGGDQYEDYGENPFILADTQSVSTFSVDADGGAYANIKRYILDESRKPPVAAVRIEEMLNYFPMNYAEPAGSEPIALNGEVAQCPWNDQHKLIRIGIKGRSIPLSQMPTANWVLLLDVSGSMSGADKLPLVKQAMTLFVEKTMRPDDRLAIVTYAGQAGVALPSTSGTDKNTILNAIAGLGAGGSTAGAQGINTAYEIAEANFIPGGNNRIVLATDGDFNVGISSTDALIKLIEEKRDKGIFFTVIGVGRGNLNDAMMEQLANNGNGTYEYMGDLEQAEKIMVHEFGKLYTVAKDVKVQVAFNPAVVKKYRLIGYENRVLNNQDFTNDQKDAGEIGAGQTITALYEIEPAGGSSLNLPMFTIDFRYKQPDGQESQPLSLEVPDANRPFASASENFRFAASTAAFGMLLRDSQYKGSATYDKVLGWSEQAATFDPQGYRKKFTDVVKKAKSL